MNLNRMIRTNNQWMGWKNADLKFEKKSYKGLKNHQKKTKGIECFFLRII